MKLPWSIKAIDYVEIWKKQKKCKHPDLTILAEGPEFAVLFCPDCEKKWTEEK